jgi:hypothetical protein
VPPILFLFLWCPFRSRIFGIWLQYLLSFLPLPIVPILWPDFPYLATASPLLLSSLFCGRNFVILQRRRRHSFSSSPRSLICPFFCPIWPHYRARKLHIFRVNCVENIRCMSHTLYQMPTFDRFFSCRNAGGRAGMRNAMMKGENKNKQRICQRLKCFFSVKNTKK